MRTLESWRSLVLHHHASCGSPNAAPAAEHSDLLDVLNFLNGHSSIHPVRVGASRFPAQPAAGDVAANR